MTTYFTMDSTLMYLRHASCSRGVHHRSRPTPKFYSLLFCSPLCVTPSSSLRERLLAFPHRLRHPTRPRAAEPSSAPSESLSLLESSLVFVIVPSRAVLLIHTPTPLSLKSYPSQRIKATTRTSATASGSMSSTARASNPCCKTASE